MHLALLRKAESRPGVEAGDRRAIDAADVGEPGSVRGLELPVELLDVAGLRGNEVAVEPAEVAIDLLLLGDQLHAIDRGAVTFDDEPRALLAVQLLEDVDPVVHRGREVRGRAAGLAAADRAVVDDDDMLARLGQHVGGREPGDAGADDADVGLDVVGERRVVGHGERALPDGLGLTTGMRGLVEGAHVSVRVGWLSRGPVACRCWTPKNGTQAHRLAVPTPATNH